MVISTEFFRNQFKKEKALYLHKSHFFLTWKSQGVIFKQAIEQLERIFKIVDNYITEEKVDSLFEYEIIPKKIDLHLTKLVLYELETRNTDRTRLYKKTSYILSNLAGKKCRDLTPYQIAKCVKDTLIFAGDNCISNASDFLLKFKRKERKVEKSIVNYNLQLHAHNGSAFDTWNNLKNILCDEHIFDIIKIGKGIISLGDFNGYTQNNKKQFPKCISFLDVV